ncbi:MAG: cell wall metabolism sensor histidine kinase WalK [Actinobacteria bacterium]|nr:cell wall metabolism sensor histidine kinase WalK [Actinomycetota bacterium]MBU1943307.1 cell wall metabolism sensor histidine kinase WalK [Actinomycetota bacterium]MBU2686575.1 cell wall metabolism sensor histidine kinase WalK [Actinomycetota bacterium]
MFKSLRTRIVATYLLVVIISLLLASIFFVFFLTRYIRDRERSDLVRQVGAVANDIRRVNEILTTGGTQTEPQSSQPVRTPIAVQDATTGQKLVTSILSNESQVLEAKLVLTTADGSVVAESPGRPEFGRRNAQLPADIFSEQGPRIVQRYFAKLGTQYLFASAPTTIKPGTGGYLLAMKPVEEVKGIAGSLVFYVAIAGLIALAISMGVAAYLSGAITRPVREVTAAARSMAVGDYSQEVPVRGSDETAELARDFNVMAGRVRTAYEQQRNFVGNVSHELRTPLTSIEGFSQALLDGVTQGPEESRRSLEIINQESKRLVRVLRDLLLLSQIDAGELRGEKREAEVTELLRKLESIYEQKAEESGVSLGVEVPDSPLKVYTDPDRLERVLVNLLDNAFKYTPEGGAVSLSAAATYGAVRISVADSGRGIAPEMLPSIFERFYRVEKSRSTRHGGAGLGLSICRELVETLGGTILVRSQVGVGTTFTVTLPA